jgi:hypothetical protein
MGEACSSDGKGERVYRVLVRKPAGNRPLWRPRRRWQDNTKMDLQELGCGGMYWMKLAFFKDFYCKQRLASNREVIRLFCNRIIVPLGFLTYYCAGDKIQKNEIGGACSSDGEGKRG